jgi:hypothetical protein
MALESATYINQLVATNPTLADPKSQGDDHLRMIKRVLQQTFPNINAAVTATPAQLNKTTDATVFLVPNMIMLWAGTVASIPTGWKLCNGSGVTSTGLAVPDLRNRFVIGAGSTYAPGAVGGATTHSHTITVGGTALTIAQIPAHTHTFNARTGEEDVQGGSSQFGRTGTSMVTTSSVGGGATHTHTATDDAVNHLPPYYALAYIIKN